MARYVNVAWILVIQAHLAPSAPRKMRITMRKSPPQAPNPPFRRSSIRYRPPHGRARAKHKTHKSASHVAPGLFNQRAQTKSPLSLRLRSTLYCWHLLFYHRAGILSEETQDMPTADLRASKCLNAMPCHPNEY